MPQRWIYVQPPLPSPARAPPSRRVSFASDERDLRLAAAAQQVGAGSSQPLRLEPQLRGARRASQHDRRVRRRALRSCRARRGGPCLRASWDRKGQRSSCFTVVPPVRNAVPPRKRRARRGTGEGQARRSRSFCPLRMARARRHAEHEQHRARRQQARERGAHGRRRLGQVPAAGAHDDARRERCRAPRRAGGCAAGRPTGATGCDQTSLMPRHPGKRSRGWPDDRPPDHCVRSEVEFQSALRSVRERRARRSAAPGPVLSTISLYPTLRGAGNGIMLAALFERTSMKLVSLRLAPPSLLVAAASRSDAPAAPRLLPRDAVAEQQKVEREFRAIPDPGRRARNDAPALRQRRTTWARRTARKNAEWILARFKEWGLDAHIETFDVLFPTPKERLVELVEPVKFRAALAEPPLKDDPTSGQTAEQLPTYNAYSDRRRRHRAARLRQLRHARRLRDARARSAST